MFLEVIIKMFLRTKDCIKNLIWIMLLEYVGIDLFDVKLMDKMINIMLRNDYDIVTNVFPRSYPKGLTCEVAKSKILPY